ncbi:MAG: type II secretion system protein [Candidatus Magasanikbacteria bacterium]|nr:type II secretion system protein [Candidatus Magasanikbacteria bacterium]
MGDFAVIPRPRFPGGFTLLEVLLTVALISILAGVVIIAINPGRQFAATRDAQRRADINTILNAFYLYLIDNKGQIPAVITTSRREICPGLDPDDCVNLSFLTDGQTYFDHLPRDPLLGENGTHTGYYIEKNLDDRITVGANGELQPYIEISR